jgi:Arginase/agmatinase/formimionoglutamate hydrolase, arginase family
MKTYAGIPEENATLENSKVMLVTVPYDGTSTWGKGADKGPELFLDASENMELYDIETGTEPYLEGVYLAEEVSEDSTPEAMTEAVYQKTKELLQNEGKLFTLFGGEHSVSIGSIRAVGEKFENLTVLQLDAHTDLRPEFHGSTSNMHVRFLKLIRSIIWYRWESVLWMWKKLNIYRKEECFLRMRSQIMITG